MQEVAVDLGMDISFMYVYFLTGFRDHETKNYEEILSFSISNDGTTAIGRLPLKTLTVKHCFWIFKSTPLLQIEVDEVIPGGGEEIC